jgi:hypothetical protein
VLNSKKKRHHKSRQAVLKVVNYERSAGVAVHKVGNYAASVVNEGKAQVV